MATADQKDLRMKLGRVINVLKGAPKSTVMGIVDLRITTKVATTGRKDTRAAQNSVVLAKRVHVTGFDPGQKACSD
ncbi:MAG: hypothetical protein JNJ83_23210 [Verrucomicrobiaceae bacterium]|nr:hypothetical protein [Verrucomicrobiaceae bacterium]